MNKIVSCLSSKSIYLEFRNKKKVEEESEIRLCGLEKKMITFVNEIAACEYFDICAYQLEFKLNLLRNNIFNKTNFSNLKQFVFDEVKKFTNPISIPITIPKFHPGPSSISNPNSNQNNLKHFQSKNFSTTNIANIHQNSNMHQPSNNLNSNSNLHTNSNSLTNSKTATSATNLNINATTGLNINPTSTNSTPSNSTSSQINNLNNVTTITTTTTTTPKTLEKNSVIGVQLNIGRFKDCDVRPTNNKNENSVNGCFDNKENKENKPKRTYLTKKKIIETAQSSNTNTINNNSNINSCRSEGGSELQTQVSQCK